MIQYFILMILSMLQGTRIRLPLTNIRQIVITIHEDLQ